MPYVKYVRNQYDDKQETDGDAQLGACAAPITMCRVRHVRPGHNSCRVGDVHG